MRIDPLAERIHRRLRAAGRAERRRACETILPTALEVIGVTTPDLRRIVKQVGKELGDEIEDLGDFLGLESCVKKLEFEPSELHTLDDLIRVFAAKARRRRSLRPPTSPAPPGQFH